MVIGHARNRENRRQQHRENRSAHVATIGALVMGESKFEGAKNTSLEV